mgnify:CR=1 FL=1
MIKQIVKDPIFLQQKSEPASEAEMGAVGGWSKAASPEITEAYKKMATENEESGKTTESTEKFEKFETDTEEQSSTEAESEPIEG